MSKLLKFIVNLFLIGAIATAVAILVPPLAGVTTTIVDTPAMNTNLPLGSITYSTDINVYDIKPGDMVLKENDSSTYAYVIHEADPANGRFMAVSAADERGSEEEVILRNEVSKVAVTVPFIGYIVMAMHSIEGIVIIALVVILMIILFILSELWKRTPEDEEEEEEAENEEAAPAPQVTAREETDIDTDAIREAVEENHTAVQNEDGIREVEEPVGEEPSAEPAAEPASEASGFSGTSEGAAVSGTDLTAADSADQTASGEQTSDADLSAAEFAGITAGGVGLAKLADEMEKNAELSGELPADEAAMAEREGEIFPTEENKIAQTESFSTGTDENELAVAEAEFFGLNKGKDADEFEDAEDLPAKEDESAEAQGEQFEPVLRPEMDEILEQARTAGKDPVVRKDERSGISMVDMSGLL